MANRRRISNIVMGLIPIIIITYIGVWYGMDRNAHSQHNKTSSPPKKDLGANKSSPCPLNPIAGTVDSIVESIGSTSNNYVSLVHFIINFDTGDTVQHNQTLWHWGLGGRGKFMLYLPYDNYSLSFTSLNYGIHSVSITLNTSIVDKGSFSDICLVNILFEISRQVRLRVQTPYSNDIEYDVICKELDESRPFNMKLIPGHSLFQLQASTYYKCWNISEINVPENDIHCFIVILAFCVTYPIICLIVAYTVWCIYAGAFNHQKDEEESVNILQINSTPSLFGPYSLLVYAILFFLPYLVFFFWHVFMNEEYKNRSKQRGEGFKKDTWVHDLFVVNILYLSGLLVLCMYISWCNNDGHVLTEPLNVESKKTKIFCFAVVFSLCFLRLSATIILFVEIISFTVIGMIINVEYMGPIWINVISAVLFLIATIRQFFDKYQTLYYNIYSIGRKTDDENTFPIKILEQSQNHGNGASQSQRQFMIKSSLLKDIVKRRLPLSGHIFNAIKHIIIGLVFIGGVAVTVSVIDQNFRPSLLTEYAITIVSLLTGAGVLRGNPQAAGEKAKNRAEDEFIQLEADLIQYANTGQFPQPEASQWRSFFKRGSSQFSNAPERNQDGEYVPLEGSNDSHSLHSV